MRLPVTEYLQWVRATFPDETTDDQIKHLKEEFSELMISDFRDAGEFADVLMLLFCVAEGRGFDLAAAFEGKFAINKMRKWEKTERGYRHAKP